MIKRLLAKWFGIELELPCNTCEVLRSQLDESNRERRELLNRLLEHNSPEPPVAIPQEEMKPIGNQHIPWRVRQQMLEQEDRVKAKLMKDRTKEIEDLEKSLDIGVK